MHRGRFQQIPFLSRIRKQHMTGIILGLLCSLIIAAVAGLLVAIFVIDRDLEGEVIPEDIVSSQPSPFNLLGSRRKPETLVLYSFSHTDFAYHHNLLYYLRHGVHEDDGCHHMIIINNSLRSPVRTFSLAYSSSKCRAAYVVLKVMFKITKSWITWLHVS